MVEAVAPEGSSVISRHLSDQVRLLDSREEHCVFLCPLMAMIKIESEKVLVVFFMVVNVD